ncbi:hypothetical protein [Nocardia asteroides]|uniref:hypothetical protein n=1 Tax=Nocardia asteroides TaxID=1824 RepID=UPI001E40FF89|nr:hypothetical protein [Nocardia asteroides]UGT57600.1 hypothetical protein LTT85_12480 [Nocardia asteroides]
MSVKSSVSAAALAIACVLTGGVGVAAAEPASAPAADQRHEAMAGFSAVPCLPWILPPSVNVRDFLICLA